MTVDSYIFTPPAEWSLFNLPKQINVHVAPPMALFVYGIETGLGRINGNVINSCCHV